MAVDPKVVDQVKRMRMLADTARDIAGSLNGLANNTATWHAQEHLLRFAALTESYANSLEWPPDSTGEDGQIEFPF